MEIYRAIRCVAFGEPVSDGGIEHIENGVWTESMQGLGKDPEKLCMGGVGRAEKGQSLNRILKFNMCQQKSGNSRFYPT